MSQYGKSAFDAYYNSTTGPLRNDIAGNITGLTLQQFAKDIADSVLFKDSFYDTDTNSFEGWDWFGADTHGFGSSSSGAGAGNSVGTYGIDTTKHANGVMSIVTGSTSAGLAMLSRQFISVGSHYIRHRQRNALETISSAPQRYTARCGFGDSTSSGEHTNGIFFRYTDSVNSGKWQCVTRAAGVETATDSGLTADTNYHIFEIQVNQAGTSVGFYVDGVLKQTHTTNITAVTLYQHWKIEKSIGTTSVSFDQDWYDLLLTRSSAR